ncbi:MAG: oligopeptide transporter, OPT family [Thermoanaerobaculia bacterium]
MPETPPSAVDQPLVAPDRDVLEITAKGLLLGAFLSMVLAAANAYIGLLVGLTVSASIPAAAVSMGVLRAFKRSSILENNLVQTSASAGESLVAGIIFTIPALVILGAWPGYRYGPMLAIAILGGVLGVAFTIPLRQALIIEARLKFPEGVATAEVLKTGGIETGEGAEPATEESAAGFRRLVQAAGLGAVIKLCEAGFGWLAGTIGAAGQFLSGRLLLMGNVSLSPALIGVGYIVGLNIAVLVFLGGVIGTVVGVPLNWAFNGANVMSAVGIDPSTPWGDLSTAQWATLAGQAWQDCRRIGVGAMIVGGVWSLISLAKPLAAGVRSGLAAYRAARSGSTQKILRTEFDTPINYVGVVALVAMVPVFLIFMSALADYPHRVAFSAVMTVLMLVFGFIFSCVAGYMAGLVGSSNNPISGVTIATVVVSALILLKIMGNEGIAATLGPIAVLYLAGLICSAAAIAGDNMQDLKCGHIVGATPWKQQLFQVIGVIAAAFVIPWVLRVLDAGYGIGRVVNPDVTPLAAPQAALMGSLASGIFGAGINWRFIFIGFGLAVALIVLDEIQKRRGSSFRFPVLAVAVGVYLPLGLSVPIFVGGLVAWAIGRRSARADDGVRQRRENAGLLVASGLITGEALMGVAISIAAVVLANMGSGLPGTIAVGPILGVLAMLGVVIYQYRRTLSAG